MNEGVGQFDGQKKRGDGLFLFYDAAMSWRDGWMASLTTGGDDDVVWARDEIEAVTCKSGDAANQRRARR